MDKAAVVILHYADENSTRECLESVFAQLSPQSGLPVILVSNSPLSERFRTDICRDDRVKLIENKENTGFARGNNIGIKYALSRDSKYILLLNNDTIISRGLTQKLLDFAKTEKNTGLISPKIHFAKGSEFHKDRYDKKDTGRVLWYAGGIIDWKNVYAMHRGVDEVDVGQFDKTTQTDFATGCCLLIKKDVIEKIGFLDEKYFLYFEDVDYSVRAKKAGFKVIYYCGINIWHKNAQTSGKPGSGIHIYYQTRNRLYFGFQYAGYRTKKSLLYDSLRLFQKNGAYRRGVLDYYMRRMDRRII